MVSISNEPIVNWLSSNVSHVIPIGDHGWIDRQTERQTDRQTNKQIVNKRGPFFSHPVDKSNHILVGQSVSQTIGQSLGQSFSYSVTWSVSRSVSHSVSNSVTQSVSWSVSQAVTRSVRQLLSQSLGLSVSRWLGQSYLMTDQLFQCNQHIIHEYLDVFQSASD